MSSYPAVYTDYREMLDRERPDLVSICTPPCFHAEVAIETFAHSAHVICEKPMAKSAGEGSAMIAAAQKAGRLLTIVFNQRYEPQAIRQKSMLHASISALSVLKGFVDSGRLGEAYFGRVCYTHQSET